MGFVPAAATPLNGWRREPAGAARHGAYSMGEGYEGSCHCGAIGWTYRTALAPSEWPVRSCQCSFCRRHATRCTSDPSGSVEFSVVDGDALRRYRFGLQTAEFLTCRRCGVYIGAYAADPGGGFATLNLNALKTPIDDVPAPTPTCYDSEDRDGRIRRREQRWTPVAKPI